MTTIPQRRWHKGLALALAVGVSAMPVVAHAADPSSPRDVTSGGRVAARSSAPSQPMRMTEAIRVAAERHSAGLTQAPAPPRRRTAAGCAGRIALFGAGGAATGLAAAAALLASTGGSDDTSGILTRYGLLGAGVGAVVGGILCAA